MREIKITPYGVEETMIGQETCPPTNNDTTARDAAFAEAGGVEFWNQRNRDIFIWNAAIDEFVRRVGAKSKYDKETRETLCLIEDIEAVAAQMKGESNGE